MSNIEERLSDYRSLRDSARKVLMTDIEHARTTFSAKGLTSRYLGGVAEGAKDVYEVARVHTVDNRGIIAIVLGALALWFGREPLLAAMAEDLEMEDREVDSDEPLPAVQASETDPEPEEASPGDTHDN
ncbi:hypothetical protein [uncultured Erythrobacter sp.]|uniref:hypothetical protein n=1 Tax=uncultured Erythrobacter sp. TaxID=263913 RepID=UPI0026328B3A|nr:hypothetical protein [uncultured Erythrobacter sp.]